MLLASCSTQTDTQTPTATPLSPTLAAFLHLPHVSVMCRLVDFSDADAFLNSKTVRAALGVPSDTEWQECNMLVNAQFYGAHVHA